ncbi:MAG: hypothetical protein HZC54_10725 [Verrucomicrobia bacterium]|nr:hypothetical protein [Verrucomicrobiota bacterium]
MKWRTVMFSLVFGVVGLGLASIGTAIFIILYNPLTEAKDHAFKKNWITRISSDEAAKTALRAQLADLKKCKMGTGLELQGQFFKSLCALAPIENLSEKECRHSSYRFPSKSVCDALDAVLGEGAAAEFGAAWLWNIPVITIRAYVDDAVVEKLIPMGRPALPALYRIMLNRQPSHGLEAYARGCEVATCSAVARIAGVASIPDILSFLQCRYGYKDDVAALLEKFGYEAIPYLIKHLDDSDVRIKIVCWNVVSKLTGQAPPGIKSGRTGEPMLPENSVRLFQEWWDRKKEFFHSLPRYQELHGSTAAGFAMATPSTIFTVNGKWGVGCGFVRGMMGISRRINVVGPQLVEVVDPEGKSILLYGRDEKPFDYWLDYGSHQSGFSPSFMSVRENAGPSAAESNVFDKPGKYRLRATMQIQPLSFISHWRTIRSEWITLWIVDSQEWMKPEASAPR